LDPERAQRMREAARGLGDHVRVTRVSLGLAGVKVSDATHRKARQIGDENARIASDRDRKRPDTRWLVDDEQCLPMLPEPVDQRSELGFIVRQAAVKQSSAGAIQRDSMVS